MKCEQFSSRLDQLLDDRLSPMSDQAINTHVESCAKCAQILETSMLVNEYELRYAEQEKHPLPADFAQRVVSIALTPHDGPESVEQPSQVRLAQADIRTKPAIEAELIDATPPVAEEVVASPNTTDRRITPWRAVSVAVCAVVVLLMFAIPITNILTSPEGPESNLAENSATNGENANSNESIENGEAVVSEPGSERRSFLGPAPFSTGGNIAVTLSVIELPIEDMGLSGIEPEEIPAVAPIAKSMSALVDMLWQSIPSFRFRPIHTLPSPLAGDLYDCTSIA